MKPFSYLHISTIKKKRSIFHDKPFFSLRVNFFISSFFFFSLSLLIVMSQDKEVITSSQLSFPYGGQPDISKDIL